MRRTFAAVLALVVTLCLVAVGSYWLLIPSDLPAPEPLPPRTPAAESRCGERPSDSSPPADESSLQKLEVEGLPPLPPPGDVNTCDCKLTVTGARGHRVADASLLVGVIRKGGAHSLRIATDHDGEASFRCEHESVLLFSSPDFHLSPRRIALPAGDEFAASISATRKVGAYIEFVYPDGDLMKGAVELEQPRIPTKRLRLDGRQRRRVEALADGLPLTLWAWPQRVGFKTQLYEVSGEEVAEGALIHLELTPAKHAVGQIVLDLTSYRASTVSITVMGADLSGILKQAQRYNGDEWRSGSLRTGQYVVLVTQGETAWQSDIVSVSPSQEIRLRPQLRQPAEVCCRILDEDGEPLRAGVLARGTQEYIEFPARSEEGWIALSDEEGIAVLARIPQGKRELTVEAEGYEPVMLEVDVRSGVSHDLGEVRLRPANGELTVMLKGADEELHYRVWLHRPSGNECRAAPPVDGADGRTRFSGLPLRKYYVVVVAGRGGSVRDAYVTLDDINPEQVTEVDVTGLRPGQD